MKEIKHLAEEIGEELNDAEKYAREAARLSDSCPADAAVYADLSRQELGHADKLHEMATRRIEKKRESGAEVPPGMQAIWDWEHEKMLDRAAHVKSLLSMM